ncbi:histone-lysine N-methyltransferase PRDM9-like [Ascaphus truei]|uniref:histone-lysine N-methyltransferase PRDM9-like n=1 Tax=Ascaphus truei TaxID=8439 RepID=UPI003F598B47
MNAPKPFFMSRGRRPPKPPVCNTSDSDEEWTPKCQTIVKNVRQPRGFTKKRIQAQNVCTSSKRCLEFSSSEEVEKNEQILAADGEENKEQLKGFPEDTSNTISAGTAQSVLHTNISQQEGSGNEDTGTQCNRTFGLRKRERKIYTEMNELEDDDYLFCEEYQAFFIDECAVHGSPVFIQDSAVEMGNVKRSGSLNIKDVQSIQGKCSRVEMKTKHSKRKSFFRNIGYTH